MFNLSPFTINLSQHIFSNAEVSLLDLGLKFIPTVKSVPLRDILQCHSRNLRNLKLRDFFAESDRPFDPDAFVNKFVDKSSWTPAIDMLSNSTQQAVFDLQDLASDLIDPRVFVAHDIAIVRMNDLVKDNISSDERAALLNLSKDRSIIIKPADKGGAVVIVDRDAYLSEAHRQLYNVKYYQKIERPLANETVTAINSIIADLLDRGFISSKQFDYLSADVPTSSRAFYLLPKVHKPISKWPSPRMPEGRPIVSDVNSETFRICEFIDFFLKPLATRHLSYVKDTYDFIARIRNRCIASNCLLVTGDLTSLYTNMHIDRSLRIVENIFALYPDSSRPDSHILKLLEICLRFNDFEFAHEIFLQVMGTAMGKAFAPNLANLYLLEFDEAIRNGFRIKPDLFFRYIDDVFFVWPDSESSLSDFRTFLNSIIPDITISFTVRHRIIEFLDTLIYKLHVDGNTVLKTRVFFKPTDTHQLLHGRSFHPRHTCRGILKSQLIRFKRICSTFHEFNHAALTLFKVLQKRGYNRHLFRLLKYSVWHSNVAYDSIDRSKSDKDHVWPIIHFFDPISTRISFKTRKRIARLNISNSFKLISAFKIHKNLSQYLVRSKML